MATPEQPKPALHANTPRERVALAVRLYSAALWRYCYGRLRDRHLAEDAVQETFLRAHRAIASAGAGGIENLPAWLFGTARRCCLEMGRRRRPVRAGDSAAMDALCDPAADGRGSPDVDAAMEQLADGERALVALKHVEGLKCREIADRLGMPLGTVTGTLARAYGKLRLALKAQQE